MGRRKKSIQDLVAEIIEDKLEIEMHRQLRKVRGVVAKNRKKTAEQFLDLKALPMPEVIDGEVIEEPQMSFLSKEKSQVVEEDIEQGRD